MGECLVGKKQYLEALVYLQKAYKIYQTQIFCEKDPYLARALNNMGIFLIKLQEYADALNSLKESLEIYKKLSLNEHIASKIESIRIKIDECLLKLG